MQDQRPGEWIPSRQDTARWTLYSIILLVVGVVVFTGIWGWRWGESAVSLAGSRLLVGLVVTLVLVAGSLVLHEWVHGQAIRAFGGTPHYGATMVAKVMPAFYCTSPGHLFTRRQFVVVALAPFVVISLLSAAVILLWPWGGWLVIPTAFHLSGCVGDFAMVARVARLAPGTLVEDRITGLRFHSQTL